MADEEEGQAPVEVTDPVRIQEGLLRRATVLRSTVESLTREITNSYQLPPYPAFASRLASVRDNLNELMNEFQKNQALFSSTVLLPNMEFPARYRMDLLDMLLRTKMEPHVEDWEQQHLKVAHDQENKQDREKREGSLTTLSDRDRRDFWNSAVQLAQKEAVKHVWFTADYTMAEKEAGIENVRHGLKRKLEVPELPDTDEDDEELFEDEADVEVDDEADESDDMDIDIAKPQPQNAASTSELRSPAQPPMSLDKIHRFMTRGELP